MNVFRELEAIGFGLADLKQIWYTILEISNIKKITTKEAVSRFIKDVEEQYYSKLSFEDMVKEERDDLYQLKKKVHEHRQILQCQPFHRVNAAKSISKWS
jgi:methyltransferase-like protein